MGSIVSRILVCVFLLAALAAMGCASSGSRDGGDGVRSGAITPGLLKSRCIHLTNGHDGSMPESSCDPFKQDDICTDFAGLTTASYPDEAACRQACRDKHRELYSRHVTTRCAFVVQWAETTCSRYCMQHY